MSPEKSIGAGPQDSNSGDREMLDTAAIEGDEEGEGASPDGDFKEEEGKKDQAASDFFIVGIGASAGGLEALTALLSSVKLDCMAFVVIQHLAPKHESFLPALLSRTSNVNVVAAADGTRVEANRVCRSRKSGTRG
jgi:chemotaxis response regulator CheB